MEGLFPPTIDGTAYLEITHRCNFSCKHCYAECPKQSEMSFEQVNRAAKVLKQYNFKKVIISGGEPLLVPHLGKTIDLLKKDFKVVLVTNGTLVREKKIDFKKLDGVYISFDGPSEKEYKDLRGKKGFQVVQDNIKWLVKQCVKVSVGIIVSKYNLNSIEKLIQQSKSLNVEQINVTVIQPFGRALKNKDLLLSPETYLSVVPKLCKIKGVHFESMFCYPKQLMNDSREVSNLSLFDKYVSGCAAGKKFIYIHPEGYVTPCGYATADKKLLKMTGNIFEQDLKEIYKSPLFQFFLNRSWESVRGKCKKCDYSVICKGGCPLRSLYLSGDPQVPDPWCTNKPEQKEYLRSGVSIKNFEKVEVVI